MSSCLLATGQFSENFLFNLATMDLTAADLEALKADYPVYSRQAELYVVLRNSSQTAMRKVSAADYMLVDQRCVCVGLCIWSWLSWHQTTGLKCAKFLLLGCQL